MTQVFALLFTVGIGAGLGWVIGRLQTRTSKRILAFIGALVIVFPVCTLMLANFLNSEALGWIAGLSLIIALASAPPLAVGAAAGWVLARRSQQRSLSSSPDPATPSPSPRHSSDPLHRANPHEPSRSVDALWTRQRGLLLAMAGVAAGYWVMLALGFRLNDQQAPSGLDSGLLPASLVLITALVLGVRHAWRHRDGSVHPFSFSVPRLAPRRSDGMAERRAWLAALAADPRRQRYAAMIEAGDAFWTADRIDYDLNLQATMCCQHLAPIESAIRATGLQVRMDAIGMATADCRIDADALARRYALPASVTYDELKAYDRSLEDPEQARLYCNACGSSLWVQHPREAPLNTPVFPSITA